MFFYPCVLERRTGCFATIWLAATKGIKVQRREFLKVNVKRTCDDIMDYVLVRVPPPRPGLPRPRFSLYLSAQLQYGTVIVYHRQCAMLLEEIQSTVARLTKCRSTQRIDIEDPGRQALDPDALSSLEEHEWANDPFFGLMHSGISVPSPGTLVQLDLEVMRRVSPERPLLSSPGTPPLEALTASPGSITLLEREPASLPSSQQFEGAELVEVTDTELGMIDLLMDQSDHFPEWEGEERPERGGAPERPEREERPERGGTPEREERPERRGTPERPERGGTPERPERGGTPEREERPERMGTPERRGTPERPERGGTPERPEREERPESGQERREERVKVSSVDLQTPAAPSEDPSASGLPTEVPAALSRERTPAATPEPSSPPGQERRKDVAAERPEPLPSGRIQTRRRGRGRRQLLFMDEHTQISQDALRQQIDNPLIQTKPPVFVSLPSQMIVSPTNLLNKPCVNLPPELLLLWQQAAIIRPLSGSDLLVGERGTDSESERERERVGDRGEEGGVREEEQDGVREEENEEISSTEVLRELAESGLSQPDVSAPSLLTMEVSDREVSHDISLPDTHESQGSSVSGRSVSRMMDIPEEAQAPPGREEAQAPPGREEAQAPPGREEPQAPPGREEVEQPEAPGSRVESLTDSEEDEVTFHSLLPPEASCRTVAHSFFSLLENVASRRLCVQQDEPYGEIWITPGAAFTQEITDM